MYRYIVNFALSLETYCLSRDLSLTMFDSGFVLAKKRAQTYKYRGIQNAQYFVSFLPISDL